MYPQSRALHQPLPRDAPLQLSILACAPPRSSHITIGAKNFTEQVLLGELLAQEIEAVTASRGAPQKVDRRFYLAGSYLCHQALISGRIDAYPEYTGTALTAILKQPLNRNAQQVDATITRLYAQKYPNQSRTRSLGFEDTFAMVVRTPDAESATTGSTISDLAARAPPESASASATSSNPAPTASPASRPHTTSTSEDRPRVMDLGLLYRALSSNQVDIVAGNSTDGPIRALNLRPLEDDKHYFPPYEAVPLVREDSLRLHPEIQQAMDKLANKISATEMQSMNDAVDAHHEDVAQVVRTFRQSKNL